MAWKDRQAWFDREWTREYRPQGSNLYDDEIFLLMMKPIFPKFALRG